MPKLRDALRLDLILKELQRLKKMALRTGEYELGSSEEIICDNEISTLRKSIDKDLSADCFDQSYTKKETIDHKEINV